MPDRPFLPRPDIRDWAGGLTSRNPPYCRFLAGFEGSGVARKSNVGIVGDMEAHFTASIAAGRICRVIEAAPASTPSGPTCSRSAMEASGFRVQFWGRGLMAGKLHTMWADASSWMPLRAMKNCCLSAVSVTAAAPAGVGRAGAEFHQAGAAHEHPRRIRPLRSTSRNLKSFRIRCRQYPTKKSRRSLNVN